MKLGPFEVSSPFLLAPMAGITNSPYRRLMKSHGCGLVVSELISANGIEYQSAKTLDLLKFHASERPVGLQIFGEDVESLTNACQLIERNGADFVDLNLGCPVPKVVKKGAGAAMCRDVPGLYQILSAMVKSVSIPITIKIRTGWDESSKNGLEVVRAAADAGVTWVAIHGRTRAQGYSGKADWDAIGNIKAASPIPIIGNGDCNTPELALERYRQFGVDAVYIGRGALRNPFIFEQANDLLSGNSKHPVEPRDLLALLDEQKSYMEECFAPHVSLLHSRKFLAWYAAGYPGCHEFRRQVFTAREPDALWSLAREFFERTYDQPDLAHLSEPFLEGGHG